MISKIVIRNYKLIKDAIIPLNPDINIFVGDTHTTLPIYLDPFFVGLVLSIIGMMIGNRVKKATKEEIREYEELHIRPESEKNAVEEKKTFNLTYLYLAFGVVLGLVFVFAYAIPYMNAVR